MSAADGRTGATPLSSAKMPWVPTGPGKAFRPLRFWERGWSELMRLEPGAEVSLHRHTGPVDAYVIEGRRLLSSGEVLDPGGYQYEPAGTVDAWSATGAGPCVVHLRVEGEIEYLASDGAVTSVVSAATQAAAYRSWCEANHTAPLEGLGAVSSRFTGKELPK
jgi:2,4'-dihydroxyacetophenone dioxygenase